MSNPVTLMQGGPMAEFFKQVETASQMTGVQEYLLVTIQRREDGTPFEVATQLGDPDRPLLAWVETVVKELVVQCIRNEMLRLKSRTSDKRSNHHEERSEEAEVQEEDHHPVPGHQDHGS